MDGRLIGGDGAQAMIPSLHFWMLTDVPDRFVAAAIMAIENKYNPERTEEDIQWFAPAE